MAYIDGFVQAVPTASKEAYQRHALAAAEVFREYGATRVVECWGDDVPDGEVNSFLTAVKCKSDETVVFSWIWWPSREARDEGMQRAMNDERIHPDNNPLPFDGARMIYGGFEVIVGA